MSRRTHHEWISSRGRRPGSTSISSGRTGGYSRRLRFEPLEDRRLLSGGQVLDAVVPSSFVALPDNIESNLATYYAAVMRSSFAASSAVDLGAQPSLTASLGSQKGLLQLDEAGRPLVDVWATGPVAAVVSQLEALGAEILSTSDRYHLVEAWLNVADLPVVASISGVLSLAPVYRPFALAGSVQTQGDPVIHADTVRDPQQFPPNGYDGSPFLIGAISDSAWYLTQSQATGDLPQIVDRYGDLLTLSGTDEGRAMLEIVHDVAPGAKLAFSPGVISESFFADGIRSLASAGAKVIVDDLGWPAEPFFQDGIVAQAVDEVAASYGVTYVTAAGNSSTHSYEHLFLDANPGDPGSDYHDFDPGPGVDTKQRISVPSGYYSYLVLQWDDPFYTTNGVTHDFDVSVYDTDGVLQTSSQANDIATQRPVIVLSLAPFGSGLTQYDVEIKRMAGNGPSLLKYVLRSSADEGTIDEYATNSGTIYGHAAAATAIAVGAVPYDAPGEIEPFSSQGDVTIYFDPQGNRLATPEVRHKPDVVAPDKVATSLSGFQPFSGTSASAPHVAGVAALLLDANPHLTRAEVYNILTSTATDLGSPGRDSVYGYGLVNAQAGTTAALVQPDVTSPTAQMTSPGTQSGWHVPYIDVQFSEPMNSTSAINATNYLLIEAGPDGTFGSGDDISYTVTASYTDDARETRLTFAAPSTTLPDGSYRLTLKAVGGLADPVGNSLNGGINQVFAFTIAFKGSIIVLEDSLGSGLTGGIDVRPDGRAVMVYPWTTSQAAYPGSDNVSRPELSVGQYDANGQSEGPYRYLSLYPTLPFGANSITSADVAVNAAQGVVVYEADDVRGYGSHAYFQSIGNDGRPLGVATLVDSADSNKTPGFFPRAAMNDTGAFVVVFWERYVTGPFTLKGRFFDANGSPTTAPFTIDPTTIFPDFPDGATSVALSDDGTAIFSWVSGNQVYARRFQSNGSPLGDIFIVNTTQYGFATDVAVAADSSFVVAWYGTDTPLPNNSGVFFRRFDATGNPVGPATHVGSYYDGSFTVSPQLAIASDGRFVVAWAQREGDQINILAQRFTPNGSAYGDPIWANRGMTGSQPNPKIAMADNGNFLITWGNVGGGVENRYSRSFSWEGTDQPSPALPGDYNENGIVDAADYTVWRNTLGTGGLMPYEGADGSGDQSVGPEDYQVWKTHYGDRLPSVAPELSGDYNQNTVVDAADYTVWRDTLGQSSVTPYSGADGSGNGAIDAADYGVWKSHFGETLEGRGADGLAVDGGDEGKPPAEPGATERALVDVRIGDLGRQPPALPGVELADAHLAQLVPHQSLAHQRTFHAHEPPAEPGAVGVFTAVGRASDDGLLAWLSSAANGRYDDDSDDDNLDDNNSEQWADDRPADESGDGLLESDGFLENIDAVFQLVGSGA